MQPQEKTPSPAGDKKAESPPLGKSGVSGVTVLVVAGIRAKEHSGGQIKTVIFDSEIVDVFIKGNTYPYRQIFKEHGFRWDGSEWFLRVSSERLGIKDKVVEINKADEVLYNAFVSAYPSLTHFPIKVVTWLR